MVYTLTMHPAVDLFLHAQGDVPERRGAAVQAGGKGVNVARVLAALGVKTVIYTDIARDGALSGTNLEIYETLRGIEGLDIVASGGISDPHELERLRGMGLYGAIVGKAIYAGRMTLEDALAAAGGQGGGRSHCNPRRQAGRNLPV